MIGVASVGIRSHNPEHGPSVRPAPFHRTAMAAEDPVIPHVVYVAGWGRSGSTLLNRMLTAPEVFGAGEVRWLFKRGIINGEYCSCGHSWRSCDLWGPVVRKLVQDGSAAVVARQLHADGVVARRRVTLGRSLGVRGDRYVSSLGLLYKELARNTGSSVIVDSSKDPAQALLARLTGLPVTVVHLVRDPRAVVWSHLRRKLPPVGATAAPTPRRAPAYVATRWLVRNLYIELRGRADLRVRYEDLIADADATLEAVLARCPVSRASERMPEQHVIAGNPDRFTQGPVDLRIDDEWKRAQPLLHRWTATAITLPLLGRYGYTVRG